MKPKYKIGTMVRVQQQDQPSYYGTINKIIIQATGIEYGLDAAPEETIGEKAIAATYTAKETVRQPKRKPRAAKPAADETQTNSTMTQ